jgi:type IV pilus assembly protein PilA
VKATKVARQRKSRGFTLIELMVVVAIVGVLSTLAVVGYRKMVNSSHVSEGSHMVQAIRLAQETFRAETGRYQNVGWATLCPFASATPPTRQKMNWNPGCNGGNTTWNTLPVRSDGPVMFGYGTISGQQGQAQPAIAFQGEDYVAAVGNAPNDWFVIGAAADIDGATARNTVILGSSFTNELSIRNDGE